MRESQPKSRLLPGEFEKQTLAELFDGITVGESVHTSALDLMQEDSMERRLLVTSTRDANLDEQNCMMRRRDARIRALLDSPSDRARFDVNAAAVEHRRNDDDPQPPACARQP